MRWIYYATFICIVAIQLSYSLPYPKESLEGRENLQRVNTELEYPSVDLNNRQKRTVGVFRRIFPELSKAQAGEELNVLSESASESKEVRVPFVPLKTQKDLQTAASGEVSDKADSSQEEFNDDVEITESDENSRSKRLGVFGNLWGGSSGGDGGSDGGSGNFLFDIIRKSVDGAARAAGTIYRTITGTDNVNRQSYTNDVSASSESFDVMSQLFNSSSGFDNTTLVAGSGASEQNDEASNSGVTEHGQSHALDDGYQTGIPGPITRLFVIANRGIANLVQDLILRLAQTSERLVNFKARLITAII